MLSNFIGPGVSHPAVWGKLPTHADFIQIQVKGEQAQQWQNWFALQWQTGSRLPKRRRMSRELWLNLSAQACMEEAGNSLPVAFVLAPGQLDFSGAQYVIGVMVPSSDQIGRGHPLMVYQLAPRRWLEQQWLTGQRSSRDWQFWLARLLSAVVQHAWDRQVSAKPDLRGRIEASVAQLWQVFHPAWAVRWRAAHGGSAEAINQACEPILAPWLADHEARADVAALLSGVPHFPRSDWPGGLAHAGFQSMFWQQTAQGEYVMAETSLAALWREEPTGT
ncbi:TagF domain-containing protein [Comamonas composti]|uniref:TagF domain-containing protein n=1 Tax=Comamonas composti TaxID=408558 RepID=UPI000415F98E|nr:TagF domain-containing protein [Comamonas composti]